MRPAIAVEGKTAKPRADFSAVGGRLHCKDCLHFLAPWFVASWSDPIAKVVSFTDSQFAFGWVYCETHRLKAR
jgi:hypothetical protein